MCPGEAASQPDGERGQHRRQAEFSRVLHVQSEVVHDPNGVVSQLATRSCLSRPFSGHYSAMTRTTAVIGSASL